MPDPTRPSVSVGFAWYDLWIGAFYDRAKRVLYVCPLPCLLVTVRLRPASPAHVEQRWACWDGSCPISTVHWKREPGCIRLLDVPADSDQEAE